MPTQDTSILKEKILQIFRYRGPSLPVHIASSIGISPLFASAFLSELVSEKKLKLSYMRVGNSPLYLLSGQEPLLEKFSEHLKSKEKDAFMLLKDKKVLKDSEQAPAIRVALRAIRDFAIPFRKEEEIFWRFFTDQEPEFKIEKPIKKVEEIIEIKKPEKTLGIFEKKEKSHIKKKPIIKKKPSQKKNDQFFNKVKEFLSQKHIEIEDIEGFNKNELILRIKEHGKEKLLIAFNKKRINDTDIIKSSKKASEANLPYILLSLGEPLKKLANLIDAIKNLSSLDKLE